MSDKLWNQCLGYLQEELPPEKYNTWIRPLEPSLSEDGKELVLWAPNPFVVDWINKHFFDSIQQYLGGLSSDDTPSLSIRVGSSSQHSRKTQISFESKPVTMNRQSSPFGASVSISSKTDDVQTWRQQSNLNDQYRFDNFVEGKSNQMASAAAQQVGENLGSKGYNPLLLYGGVGLGKTHLMQAAGNAMLQRNPNARVVYLHSERFVSDMVSAIRNRTIDKFQRFYRSLDALLIDDIQFFAKKDQSQEEFFHTFNSLVERGQQIILTSDQFPKEINGLEDRLKSRFGWGLSQPLEPPELETRVAILNRKAEEEGITLPDDVTFFIAQRIRSNVRELEGTLKRLVAFLQFSGEKANVGLVKEALKDMLAVQARLVSIDNIQRAVAEYYNIKLADLLSPKRTRSIARPRQIAMALSKELTSHSLPEIGEEFGGRDHTTVLHACKKVKELCADKPELEQDYQKILNSLTC